MGSEAKTEGKQKTFTIADEMLELVIAREKAIIRVTDTVTAATTEKLANQKLALMPSSPNPFSSFYHLELDLVKVSLQLVGF